MILSRCHRSLRSIAFLLYLTFIVGGALDLLISAHAQAALLLPKNLGRADRQEALRIVGFGTSGKILSDPYPLGGYQGFEIGLAIENIATDDLGRLGARLASPQQEVSFPKFTLGKGLYNDLDFFLQFTPYNRQDEISQFGGLLRWGFAQAAFLPLSASLVAHFNGTNIGNLLTTKTYGLDVIGGINVENVSLFAGVGFVESSGSFVGGAGGITDTALVETEQVSGFHTLIGANFHWSRLALTLQMDRYTAQVISGKLSYRF